MRRLRPSISPRDAWGWPGVWACDPARIRRDRNIQTPISTKNGSHALRIQYRLADHIFVHTERMKAELVQHFGVRAERVSVIPFGINNAVPHTDLTPDEAKERLGVASGDKTLLFFGNIAPYNRPTSREVIA